MVLFYILSCKSSNKEWIHRNREKEECIEKEGCELHIREREMTSHYINACSLSLAFILLYKPYLSSHPSFLLIILLPILQLLTWLFIIEIITLLPPLKSTFSSRLELGNQNWVIATTVHVTPNPSNIYLKPIA